ncbi:MAG: CDP-alcohol phosphatidyltransferase family protein [Gammaproteobacteria bacterium]|nr:CDP-alcohol phosphatidyltransferase family protein [Gammaproteobacteria bacterium]
MINKKDFFNPPNIVSIVRVFMAPVLLLLAYHHSVTAYFIVLVFTLFTDVLDGFLARHLNMITELGSHLDSWGDFIIYTTLAISAWWMWPDMIQEEMLYVVLIILSFVVPVIVGLIKFRTLTSYHTWSVKLAVFLTLISYIAVFTGWLRWPIYMAAAVSVIAAIEEVAITLIMKHEHADVRSFIHALHYK